MAQPTSPLVRFLARESSKPLLTRLQSDKTMVLLLAPTTREIKTEADVARYLAHFDMARGMLTTLSGLQGHIEGAARRLVFTHSRAKNTLARYSACVNPKQSIGIQCTEDDGVLGLTRIVAAPRPDPNASKFDFLFGKRQPPPKELQDMRLARDDGHVTVKTIQLLSDIDERAINEGVVAFYVDVIRTSLSDKGLYCGSDIELAVGLMAPFVASTLGGGLSAESTSAEQFQVAMDKVYNGLYDAHEVRAAGAGDARRAPPAEREVGVGDAHEAISVKGELAVGETASARSAEEAPHSPGGAPPPQSPDDTASAHTSRSAGSPSSRTNPGSGNSGNGTGGPVPGTSASENDVAPSGGVVSGPLAAGDSSDAEEIPGQTLHTPPKPHTRRSKDSLKSRSKELITTPRSGMLPTTPPPLDAPAQASLLDDVDELVSCLLEDLEEIVTSSLYQQLYAPTDTDSAFSSIIAALNVMGVDLRHLGIVFEDSEDQHLDRERLDDLVANLALYFANLSLDSCLSPRQKLDSIVTMHKVLAQELTKLTSLRLRDARISSSHSNDAFHFEMQENVRAAAATSSKAIPSSTDLILPILIYTILRFNPTVISPLKYAVHYRCSHLLTGEQSYCATNVEAAVAFINEADSDILGINTNHRIIDLPNERGKNRPLPLGEIVDNANSMLNNVVDSSAFRLIFRREPTFIKSAPTSALSTDDVAPHPGSLLQRAASNLPVTLPNLSVPYPLNPRGRSNSELSARSGINTPGTRPPLSERLSTLARVASGASLRSDADATGELGEGVDAVSDSGDLATGASAGNSVPGGTSSRLGEKLDSSLPQEEAITPLNTDTPRARTTSYSSLKARVASYASLRADAFPLSLSASTPEARSSTEEGRASSDRGNDPAPVKFLTCSADDLSRDEIEQLLQEYRRLALRKQSHT